MGLAASKQQNTESLNWDKINTESMSTSIPNINNISKDANELISNLSINNKIDLENTDSDNENLFTWIKTIGDDKKKNKEEMNTDSFSETSAFISSDMYKYLMNKNSDSATSNAQVGGGIQEDSSTSSTSSSPKKKNKNTKNTKKNKKVVTTSSSMSGGNLSYISSSAHTESNNETNIISSSVDNEESSISVENNQMLTSSINTSDINLVEPDSE